MDQIAISRVTVPPMLPGTLCSVTLVDRRTGQSLRRNGTRVRVLTRTPGLAAAELLEGRDSRIWQPVIEPLDLARRRQ